MKIHNVNGADKNILHRQVDPHPLAEDRRHQSQAVEVDAVGSAPRLAEGGNVSPPIAAQRPPYAPAHEDRLEDLATVCATSAANLDQQCTLADTVIAANQNPRTGHLPIHLIWMPPHSVQT